MAYYDALVAKWPSVTGANTAAKLANLNSQVVSTPKPAFLDVTKIVNAILPADFLSLTSLQLQEMQFLLQGNSFVDASPGTTIRSVFSSIFAGKATTLANLSALVSPFDNATTPWWQATVAQGGGGLSSPVNLSDLAAAGGLS